MLLVGPVLHRRPQSNAATATGAAVRRLFSPQVPPSTHSSSARAAARGTDGRLRTWVRWWAARPALCAAAFYALLSLIMVGPALLPGWTLSSSDGLWTATPWMAFKPDDVRLYGSNYELADAVAVFQPFFEFTRATLPDVPLWNPHLMAGRPFLADAQSAVFSPFTAPAVRIRAVEIAGRDRRAQAVRGRVRHVPVRADASACASAARCWPVSCSRSARSSSSGWHGR